MQNKYDFASLKADLLSQARQLLPIWIPGGRFRGNEYVAGDISGGDGESFSYNVAKGSGGDFALGTFYGDMIELYCAIYNKSSGDAYRELRNELPPIKRGHLTVLPKPEIEPSEMPPHGAPDPIFRHKEHGEPSAIYPYLNQDGELILYVVRYEFINAKGELDKTFRQFTWRNGEWAAKGPTGPKPLFGLELLKTNRPVLLVEGEKSCFAARELLGKHFAVLTWMGGSSAWDKADFSPLFGRYVVIWPDNDEPGRKAASSIAAKHYADFARIKTLNPRPDDLNDAADFLKAGFTTQQVIDWANQNKIETKKEGQTAPVEPTPVEVAADVPRGTPTHYQIRADMPLTNKAKVRNVIGNLTYILEQLGISVRYNVIKKTEELLIPNKQFLVDNRANESLAWLISECNMVDMPTSNVPEYIGFIAGQNLYNPIATWIESKPWDGESRLQSLYDTIQADNNELKEKLMYRWLISAVAAAVRPQGVSAHGVLVLQGAQYIGKTAWFKSLVPPEFEATADGMILRPDDKDSVKQICSYWIVELGEIDATFKKADMAQLKSFLTKDRDKLRAAYARRESEFARRTVFFGSVNPGVFLHDETGNRRYWTVGALSINHKHGLDMQQVWAEIYEHYKQGVTWYLTEDEMRQLNDYNERFTSRDSFEEKINFDLAWELPQTFWRWRSSTRILEELGFDRPSRSDVTKGGIILRKRSSIQVRTVDGHREYFVPPKRVEQSELPVAPHLYGPRGT